MGWCLTLGLLLVFVSNTVLAGEDCKEPKLLKCLSTLQNLALNVQDGIQNAVDDSPYCQALEKDGNCPNNKAFKDCKAKFPKNANLSSSLYTYLSSFCADKGKILKDISSCYSKQKSAFEKCWSDQKKDNKNESDPRKEICMEMKSMQCLADLGKKKCDNGKEFGSVVEKNVNNLKMDLKCGGAANLLMDIRILAVTLFSLFLMRNKYY